MKIGHSLLFIWNNVFKCQHIQHNFRVDYNFEKTTSYKNILLQLSLHIFSGLLVHHDCGNNGTCLSRESIRRQPPQLDDCGAHLCERDARSYLRLSSGRNSRLLQGEANVFDSSFCRSWHRVSSGQETIHHQTIRKYLQRYNSPTIRQ